MSTPEQTEQTQLKTPIYGLKRPKKEEFLFNITDEANPGVTVQITLIEPTIPTLIKVSETVQHYTELYLVPDKISGETPSLMPVDGEMIDLSQDLLELACGICCLQKKPIYTVEEILVLMVTMEAGMMQLIGKAKELSTKFASLMENPMRAAGIMPLSECTTKDQEDTLNSTVE